jgi:hypothetical protein
MPRSSLQFVEDRKYIDNVKHSVLKITMTDGTVWIFDGTGFQFGWKRENWLLSKADFSTLHKKGDWEEYPDKHIVREGVVGKHWDISDQLVKELVPVLNWKTMSEMGSEELEQYVKDLADAKFNAPSSWRRRRVLSKCQRPIFEFGRWVIEAGAAQQ